MQTIEIIIDTREQLPYDFKLPKLEGITTVVGTLSEGDYSAAGFEGRVSVERKSINDMVGCLTSGRERFERELERLKGYEFSAVVIEASHHDFRDHRYTSKMTPHSALQSIYAMMVRHKIPFIFAGDRNGGQYATASLLRHFCRLASSGAMNGTESSTEKTEEV